ncbi:hypothetical protein [Actinoplanes regularis]|uniref:Uncharacterized protein n=1 Tax=Actinoplanes regularis TaxID=52697 RepID=A0A239JQU7_9ACTN|nr:hypothetical protein [Actinoplanes regularis]GIE92184.1 hypothetical protein Are01nite_86640 [Actinoplanes regularis]SNT07912.1 hypothetical protein SAMN06264365_13716 [Actinoplanes regularis]
MTRAERARTVLRWPVRCAVLVIVLAAAGSAPTGAEPGDDTALYAYCRRAVQKTFDKYQDERGIIVFFNCERPDGTTVDPELWAPIPPARPAPIPVMTVGLAGCVTGPGRPVAGTTLTSALATSSQDEAIIYEFQPLDGGEAVGTSGSAALEFVPGDLMPGGSYRWRARVDDIAEHVNTLSYWRPDDERGWSPWCEFSVSADALDYSGLGDVSLEALNELGLRPDRTYTIKLSSRQQRLLREGSDIGRTSSRMTLTGPRWTDLLMQLATFAATTDDVADEDDSSLAKAASDARALVDTISVKLGGPPHPKL